MAATRRTASAAPPRLILDRGAVIALSRHDDRARAVLAAAHEAGVEVVVPSVVLAETVRGAAEDTPVNRVVKAVGHVVEVDEATARLAGRLLGAAGSSETLDALVVACAIDAGGGVVLTGDADDLGVLAEGVDDVVVQSI